MKYAHYWFLGVLVAALFLAFVFAPLLADWIANRATDAYGYAYGYGSYQDFGPAETEWGRRSLPVGSWWLIFAFVCFAALGAGIMALGWWFATLKPVVSPLTAAEKRLAKGRQGVDRVQQRDDLSSGQKEAFRDSAEALAGSSDGSSIRAAEAVGNENAVVAAKDLAQDAENELFRLMRHAGNIAVPFSDSTARTIEQRRDNLARVDTLVRDLEACEKQAKAARTCADPACDCGTRVDTDGKCGCAARSGNHARLDVVWD